MKRNVEARVKVVLSEKFTEFMPPGGIGLRDDLREIGINSLVFIKLIVAFEAEFGVEFFDEDLDLSKFKSLGDLINCIEEKLCQE